MATATVTVTNLDSTSTFIDINETGVAAGTVVTIGDSVSEQPLPKLGLLTRMTSVLVSGTGTTITPVLSADPASFTGAKVVAEGPAAAFVDEMQSDGIPFACPDGLLYHRSTPDAGSDNIVQTRYLIKKGW